MHNEQGMPHQERMAFLLLIYHGIKWVEQWEEPLLVHYYV